MPFAERRNGELALNSGRSQIEKAAPRCPRWDMVDQLDARSETQSPPCIHLARSQ